MDLLRHLRFFVAVAEARHFGQAAVSLGMSQPPLSQGIQRLERELGVRLFDRDARGVRITAAGSALLPRAESMLEEAAELRAHAGRWTEPDEIRIGFAADLESQVPALVARLRHAGFTVAPTVDGSVPLADCVRDGQLDLAVLRHPIVVDGTRPREVRTLATRLEAPRGYGFDDWARIDLPVVVPPRRHHPAAHDQLVDSLRRAGHSGAVIEEADPVARAAYVAAGRAVRLSVGDAVGGSGASVIPLRVRVVLPVPADRRPHVDLERCAVALEAGL
ncbi:LysR family transcriptional regulator [Cellulomonas edaphi]|uniref:LysR family transcriptional regulator n=1 Tax=Cellulomonas edaphi TaxID=3053468 RepID=A0ABT7S387_9CELL|nr:LysR family transcriptional regulator [Cellulomons edaphi]MDM7830088.1 LysR family transcriptional regulator [Cellulomons edaphi]